MTPSAAPLTVMLEFFRLLRLAGVRLGMAETQDALRALTQLDELRWVKAALKATLIKRKPDEAIFDQVFELYFMQAKRLQRLVAPAAVPLQTQTQGVGQHGVQGSGGGGAGQSENSNGSDSAPMDVYQQALERSVRFLMRHVYDPTRSNSARSVQEALVLLADVAKKDAPADKSLQAIRRDLERVFVQAVDDHQALPALEALLGQADVDTIPFAQMDRSEAQLIEEQIERLIEQLLSRPKRRVKPDRRGRLDVRRTVRNSLQFGGVPLRVSRKQKHIDEPKLFVLTDISGSVEVFARFFLMLTRAFQAHAGVCRSFVFADRLHEITAELKRHMDSTPRAGAAVDRLLKRLRVAGWTTRRTDYGTTLKQFFSFVERDITPRSTVVILGDARNNRAPSQAQVLQQVFQRCSRVIWLNPERRVMWDTGDSIQAAYAPYCHQVSECGNLSQLKKVIDEMPFLKP